MPKILVVDDDADVRYTLSHALQAEGFETVEAADGRRARALLPGDIDLVLLDINLPDADGRELCRQLKESPETKGIPVVFVTASYAERDDVITGLNVGADDYLVEPVDNRELVARVRALLRLREYQGELERVREQYRALLMTVPGLVWEWDPNEQRMTFVSDHSRQLLGVEAEDVPRTWEEWQEWVHPDDLASIRDLIDHLQHHVDSGAHGLSLRLRHADGHYVWCHLSAVSVCDPEADGPRLCGVLTDATAEMRMREAETRARLRAEAFDALTRAGQCHPDFKESLEAMVKSLQKHFSFSDLSVLVLDPLKTQQTVVAAFGAQNRRKLNISIPIDQGITGWVARHGEPLLVPDVRQDPRYVAVDPSTRSELCVPLKVGDDILGVVDVGSPEVNAFGEEEQKLLTGAADRMAAVLANAQLFESIARAKRRWDIIFDAMPVGVALINGASTDILRANHSFAKAFGASPQDLVGKSAAELLNDLPRSLQEWIATVPVEGPTSPFPYAPKGTGRAYEVTLTKADTDGGQGTEILLVLRDVTDQRRLRQQLTQREKLAAVGELVSGVAHELNNPLTSVLGYAQLLGMQDLPEQSRNRLSVIENEAKRAAKIVQNLLTFARRYEPELSPVQLNEVIEKTLELRAYQLRVNNIEVKQQLDEDLPVTLGDFHRLQEVLMNLITNAEQAMSEAHGKGKLTITSRRVYRRLDEDSNLPVPCKPNEPGAAEWLQIAVTDDGPGISKENLAHIFDPFYTTKDVGKGTGLGLPVSTGIVREHGGNLYCESREGQGATFYVELPIRQAQQKAAQQPETAPEVISGRVLVVDDEAFVANFVKEVLESDNHEVVAVDGGQAALEQLAHHDGFDAIVCDLKMPGMTGQELFARMKTEFPEAARRVLFLTGDSVSPKTHQFLARSGRPHLTKPVTVKTLLKAVADIVREVKAPAE